MRRLTRRSRALLWLVALLETLGFHSLSLWVFLRGQDRGWVPVIAGGVDTDVATGAAEAARIWSREMWVEALEAIFWGPYIGDSRDAIIWKREDFTKEKGETINYYQANQLTGDGVIDDGRMEDNEERILWYSSTVTLRQFRNAVRTQGKLSEQRTQFEQGDLGKDLLTDWLAGFFDRRIFTTLATSFTRAIYGGDASSPATIESGDYMTLALVTRFKTLARKVTPQIRPPEGGYFLIALSPDQRHDLKLYDPEFNEAHREAMQRGKTNPLFTGEDDWMYDGCIGRISTRVPLATDWGSGSNLNGAEGMGFGRRAGILAIGKRPEMVIQVFDYENKTGYAVRLIAEVAKSTFNTADNAVVGIRTFRSNIS